MLHFWFQTLAGATALYCWLVAGVFLAFSDFVMKSLGAIPAAQGITAMRSINILVFRSVFMVGLFAICASSIFLIGYTYITAAAQTLWARYLGRWVWWNHIRTVGAATSAAMLTYATFQLT